MRFWLSVTILSFFTACTTPVYVYKKIDIPIAVPCKIQLPARPPLPTGKPIPSGLTVKQKRDWILSAMYRDIVLLEGEIHALRVEAGGCR